MFESLTTSLWTIDTPLFSGHLGAFDTLSHLMLSIPQLMLKVKTYLQAAQNGFQLRGTFTPLIYSKETHITVVNIKITIKYSTVLAITTTTGIIPFKQRYNNRTCWKSFSWIGAGTKWGSVKPINGLMCIFYMIQIVIFVGNSFLILQDGKMLVWDAFTTNKVRKSLKHYCIFKLYVTYSYKNCQV